MDRGNDGRQAGADQQAGWTYSSDRPSMSQGPETTSRQADVPAHQDMVEWTASEYIAHEKNASWYVQVFLATIVVTGIAYLVTRDMISIVVLLFAGLIFAISGARKPRVLAYRVDQGGLTIGQRYFPFGQFKSYAVMTEGPVITVVFMPMKRFLPTLDIHLPPQNAREIIDVIGSNLPIVDRKQGLVDTVTHRIRF